MNLFYFFIRTILRSFPNVSILSCHILSILFPYIHPIYTILTILILSILFILSIPIPYYFYFIPIHTILLYILSYPILSYPYSSKHDPFNMYVFGLTLYHSVMIYGKFQNCSPSIYLFIYVLFSDPLTMKKVINITLFRTIN